jgi:hypothetical protein
VLLGFRLMVVAVVYLLLAEALMCHHLLEHKLTARVNANQVLTNEMLRF